MPIILSALALFAVAALWIFRIRNAAELTHEILDAASDVKMAARRFRFRQKANTHSMDAVEDPHVAVGVIAVSILELDSFPTAEQRGALHRELAEQLGIPVMSTEELLILSRWLMKECGGAEQAVKRASRKLYALSKQRHFEALMRVVKTTAQIGNCGLSQKQKSALSDIERGLRIG